MGWRGILVAKENKEATRLVEKNRAVLPGGVMVAQRSLEPLVMVRVHAGQPDWCLRAYLRFT